MQIIHFRLNDDPTIRFGSLREDGVVDATDLIEFDTSKPCGGINDRFNMDGEVFEKFLERSNAPTTLDQIIDLGELRVVTRDTPTSYFVGPEGPAGPEFDSPCPTVILPEGKIWNASFQEPEKSD